MTPPCPHLPPVAGPAAMNHTSLRAARDKGPEAAYLAHLQYAQQLWQADLPARALLAVDKALLMSMPAGCPVLEIWPRPFTAVVWFLREVDRGLFFGNPRVHYQHLADRMPLSLGPVARLRMWACWHLSCAHRPDLPGDPKHRIDPPAAAAVCRELTRLGYEKDALLFQASLSPGGEARINPPSS